MIHVRVTVTGDMEYGDLAYLNFAYDMKDVKTETIHTERGDNLKVLCVRIRYQR